MTATTTGTPATKGWTEGWGLFWTLTLTLAAMSLGFLFVLGWDTDGYRSLIWKPVINPCIVKMKKLFWSLMGKFIITLN